jgi:hypothetical protein
MEPSALGKKVFFLYPPPVLTEVLQELTNREFEVYLARDHERLRRVISASPDAIVFIDLDEGLDDEGWEAYVRALRAGEATTGIGVGVLTLNDSPWLRERYLMDIQVQCGFVILKVGASKTAEILVKTLEANEARGRRKFVRAACNPGAGQCAVEHEGTSLRAELTDLSSAGMAMRFEGGAVFRVGTMFRGLSITVKGQRVLVSGFVAAQRAEKGGADVHVIMFDPASLDDARREKLRSLVARINQIAMDRLLETA